MANYTVTHGMSQTPFYKVWRSMIARCTNPNWRQWASYGGRGIGVDFAWLDFATFRDDMLATYAPGLQLDRIDNEKGYTPTNCRWVTREENNRNKRTNVRLVVNGVEMILTDASLLTGIHVDTLRHRLNKLKLTEATGLFAKPQKGRRKGQTYTRKKTGSSVAPAKSDHTPPTGVST